MHSAPLFLALLGCVPDGASDDPTVVVTHAWALIDTRYAMFVDKDVDWDAALNDAVDTVRSEPDALDSALETMLATLEDGHVNLLRPDHVSWSPALFEDRVPLWDEDLVHRHVLEFDFQRRGSLVWSARPEGWGYLRVGDFSNLPHESTLDLVFEDLSGVQPLVIDLRSNGGGELDQAGRLLSRLVREDITGWHRQASTGLSRGDLDAPVARDVAPIAPGFHGAIRVLVDGRTYSAANTVAFALSQREDVLFIGQSTGGGGGSTAWFDLPNGWSLRFPTVRLTGPEQESVEGGLTPDREALPDPERPEVDAMIEIALED